MGRDSKLRSRVLSAVLVLALGAPVAMVAMPTKPASAALPPISAIGDSTLLGMTSSSRAVVNASYAMNYQAASCRRLIIISCRGRGVIPPNTIDVMRAQAGRLGDAVVIMAGYDDWFNFDVAVDTIVAEARRQGVASIVWMTYRSQGPYVGVGGAFSATYRQFNAILAQKAQQYPDLVVADWDGYTVGRPSWFSSDGIHLSAAGAMGLAGFLKATLDGIGLPRCYGGATGTPTPPPTATGIAQAAPGRFQATSVRVLDTRAGQGDPVNNPLAGGHAINLPLVASGAVPGGSSSVMVNITAVSSCQWAYVTAYPCGGPVPLASNLNLPPRRTRAALSTVMLSGAGELCIYADKTTDLVVDVFGSFGPNGTLLHPLAPDRFLDTRNGQARNARVGRIGPATFSLPVRGLGPVPAGAQAVMVNVTATEAVADGFLTVHACGSVPPVSNLNFKANQNVANLAVVALDGSGSLCVTPSVGAHVLVDVVGWLGAGAGGLRVQAQTPQRLMDTRTGLGGVAGPLPNGGIAQTDAGANGSLATITAVDERAPGYLTAYPCPARPVASNLNYIANDNVPNLAVVSPGAGGKACIFTFASSHLLVDRAATLVA
jgi:hypothetical protein